MVAQGGLWKPGLLATDRHCPNSKFSCQLGLALSPVCYGA